MIRPGVPEDETARLSELYSFQVLDTAPDPEMDAILDLLLALTGASMGTITFVDADRQWFKSRRNISVQQTSREVAFCAHGILGNDLFVVPDAREDIRFQGNPLVSGGPHVVFYAGMPLRTSQGHNIGMLCVQDRHPRHLDEIQKSVLRRLAKNVVTILELRREQERTSRVKRELEHRVQNTLQFLSSLIHLQSGTGYCADQGEVDWMPQFSARLDAMSWMLRSFNNYSDRESVFAGAQVGPIIQEMVHIFGIVVPDGSWPLATDDFVIDRDRAMVLTSLVYELVTTVAGQAEESAPEGRLVNTGDAAELVISKPLAEDGYSRLIEDYRFAIIETLARRLNADDSIQYNKNVFTARYRFAIAS
jgi:two-component sensor histidine kinase